MTESQVPPHLASLFAEFERQGEVAVRHAILSGDYANSSTRQPAAQAWLAHKEEQRKASEAATRDEREEETLAIARQALETADEANRIAKEELSVAQSSAKAVHANARWAMYAAIGAVVAALFSAKEQILALVLGQP